MTKGSLREKSEEYWRQALEAEEQENLPEAISWIEKAIELCPSDTVYWSAKGQFLRSAGRYKESKVSTRRAIELNPKNHHAWSSLALAHIHLGSFEEAAACFKRSVELKEDFGIYTMLAAAEIEFDVESAIKHAKKALELNPDWDEAREILRSAESKLHAEL